MKLLMTMTALILSSHAMAIDDPNWALHGYGPQHHKDEADGITITKNGFTYIAGGFSKHFRLKNRWLRSVGKRDIFLAKIDKRGNLSWVKTFATKNDENVYDLTTDGKGNLYMNGEREYPVGRSRKFKYSAITMKVNANNGRLIWEKKFDSPVGAGGNEITTDSKGNIYSSYISEGGMYINRKLYKSQGGKESHIIKMSSTGAIRWVVSTKGRGVERVRAISTAFKDSRIAVGFEYQGEIKVGRKTYRGYRKTAKQGAYLILDQNGKIKKFENIANSPAANVRATGGFSDGIYIHGTFAGKARLNGQSMKSLGSRDTFLMKLSKDGHVRWLRTMGSSTDQDGGELAVKGNGDAFLTGDHSGRNYYVKHGNFKSEVFTGYYPNRTAHLLKFDSIGNLTGSYAFPSSRFASAGGVVEVLRNKISMGVRFYGELAFNGQVFQAGDKRDKDFVIVNFNDDLLSEGRHPEYGEYLYNLKGRKGLLICFHGTGGQAFYWKRKPEGRAFLEDAIKNGYSVLCPTSLNRSRKQWQVTRNGNNKDVKNIDSLLGYLNINRFQSLYLIGHSQGGAMVSQYTAFSKRKNRIKAAQYTNAGGASPLFQQRSYDLPTIFQYAKCDKIVDVSRIERNIRTLERKLPRRKVESFTIDREYFKRRIYACHEFLNFGPKTLRFFNKF